MPPGEANERARPAARSLRRLLISWLVWPLAALIVISTAPTYFLSLGAANHAYDSALLDPALAIAAHIRPTENSVSVDLSTQSLDVLRIDSQDRVFVQVRGPAGELVAGTNARPPLPKCRWMDGPSTTRKSMANAFA